MPKSQNWISEKISKLRHEGYPQEQAIAIAHRMAGAPKPDDAHIPLEEGKSKEVVSRNTQKLINKGHNPEAAAGIAQRQASKSKDDDAQHMGFSGSQAEPIKKLVSQCDALAKRLDDFEKWSHQRKPKKVEPRNKDNMQPSNRHPKEVDRPK